MYALRHKTIIPHYSLQETSGDGNTLFEIKEVDGASIRKNNHLFLPHRKDYYFFFLVKKGSNAKRTPTPRPALPASHIATSPAPAHRHPPAKYFLINKKLNVILTRIAI